MFCTRCGRPLQENEICPCQQPAQPVEPQYAQAPQQQYAAPQQPYAVPQQPYAVPQQPYAAPQQQYAEPQQQYAAPQQPYGAPQQPYGAPQQPYGAPQQPYGAPYGAPQQPYGAPYGAPAKPANTFFYDLCNVIVTFFKSPTEAKALATKGGKLMIPGVLLGLYAFITMFVTWLSLNSVTLSVWNAAKKSAKEYGVSVKDMGMNYGDITKEIFNVPGLLFAGLLIAAIFVGILLLVRFGMSKIAGSNEGDFKSGLVTVSLFSIPATALTFLACICSFFSLGLCLGLSALASLFMLVSVLTDTAKINAAQLESSKWLFIFPAVIVVALLVNSLLGSTVLKIGLTEQMRDVINGMGELIKDPSSFVKNLM